MDTAIALIAPFKMAYFLSSCQDTPLSVYIFIVQAVKNMVQRRLTEEDGKYDHILGGGSAQEVLNCIGVWLNMDGIPIPGWKVGLLDKYHLWCYFLDLFNHL